MGRPWIAWLYQVISITSHDQRLSNLIHVGECAISVGRLNYILDTKVYILDGKVYILDSKTRLPVNIVCE